MIETLKLISFGLVIAYPAMIVLIAIKYFVLIVLDMTGLKKYENKPFERSILSYRVELGSHWFWRLAFILCFALHVVFPESEIIVNDVGISEEAYQLLTYAYLYAFIAYPLFRMTIDMNRYKKMIYVPTEGVKGSDALKSKWVLFYKNVSEPLSVVPFGLLNIFSLSMIACQLYDVEALNLLASDGVLSYLSETYWYIIALIGLSFYAAIPFDYGNYEINDNDEWTLYSCKDCGQRLRNKEFYHTKVTTGYLRYEMLKNKELASNKVSSIEPDLDNEKPVSEDVLLDHDLSKDVMTEHHICNSHLTR